MKARPILFSGEMVRALIEGRKTQTRRAIKPTRRKDGVKLLPEVLQQIGVGAACPYGQIGDRLWVRETWHWRGNGYAKGPGGCCYRADYTPLQLEACVPEKWTPAIHMFGWASRITLEITGVRVERLQDISEDDCKAEGCAPAWLDADDNETVHAAALPTYRQGYARLWRDINGTGSWEQNPWCWCIEFKVLP